MSGQEQPPKRPSSRYVPFVTRTKAMGSTGWEATTIGFTLVGCILAGTGLGWLLDRHFGTSYWLPILFLLGVVAGFREMMLTLGRISKNEAQRRQEKMGREVSNAYTPPSPETRATEVQAPRERLFSVPPPPFADKSEANNSAKTPETTEEIIERLLAESDAENDDKPGQTKK